MTFHVTFRGEDRTVFTRECDANSVEEVFAYAEEVYPEATVLEVFDPKVRAEELYDRARRRLEDEDDGIFED